MQFKYYALHIVCLQDYHIYHCCADGLLDMDPIVTVEEGQNVMVCISLMGLGTILGCPLTVDLDVTGSIKAGTEHNCAFIH